MDHAQYSKAAALFDQHESINIALRLGQLLESSNPEEALRNYEFAYPLIDDTNPKLPNLLARIRNLKSNIDATRNAVPVAVPRAASTSATSSKSSRTQPTEEQSIADEIKRCRTQLQFLKDNAQLSEKSHRPDEWQKWMDLATAEAQIGELDDAVKTARLAIKKYTHTDISIYSDSILLPAGSYRALPDALRRQGRAEDAQLLLNEAKNTVAAEDGPKSHFANRV